MTTMKKSEISASMMCSNLVDLVETLRIFEEEGVERLHIDMMDGDFVPNFGLGVDYIRSLRELTSIPFDLHLMIRNPEYKLNWIGIKESDIVSIHYESTFQVQRALDWLQPFGCKRFLAINPATPINSLEEVLDYIDGVNILMVNPGFAGQKMVPSTIRKVEKIRKLLMDNNHEDIIMEVDGNISPENGRKLRAFGASLFVGGTSAIFKGNIEDYRKNIKLFREYIQ